MDLSDFQYRVMREDLPLTMLVAFLFITIRKIIFLYQPDVSIRIYYYFIFGLGFLSFIHGFGAAVILITLVLNYYITMVLGKYS